MVSISSFKSSSIQHDVHFVNCVVMQSKIDDKITIALGRGYRVIDGQNCAIGAWLQVQVDAQWTSSQSEALENV